MANEHSDGQADQNDSAMELWASLGLLIPQWVVLIGGLAWLGIQHVLGHKSKNENDPC